MLKYLLIINIINFLFLNFDIIFSIQLNNMKL